MSCNLNINRSKLNPKGKFKFPGKNMNQSDYGNSGDYRSTEIIQHQLIRNINFFTILQRKNEQIYLLLDT